MRIFEKVSCGRDFFLSDVRAEYGKVSLSILARSFLNPSIRACVLVRLSTINNKLLHIIIRNILIMMHSIDVASSAVIGRGLKLPHPFCIVIGAGVLLGDNVTIYQGVTLGQKNGYPEIGKGVTIYPNSVIVGGITVGSNSIIGANVFLDKSIENDSIYYG